MKFPDIGGRPTKYEDDMPLKLVEYIQACIDGEEVPTSAGLGLFIGINRDTVFEWRKKHQAFSDSYDLMMMFQENEVWQKALKGQYNSNISKLMLANHGYSDKVSTENKNTNLDVDVNDMGDSPEEELSNILERIKKLQDEDK